MPVFFSGVFLILFLYVEYRRRKKKRAMERCVHLPAPPLPAPSFPAACLFLSGTRIEKITTSCCCTHIYGGHRSALRP